MVVVPYYIFCTVQYREMEQSTIGSLHLDYQVIRLLFCSDAQKLFWPIFPQAIP